MKKSIGRRAATVAVTGAVVVALGFGPGVAAAQACDWGWDKKDSGWGKDDWGRDHKDGWGKDGWGKDRKDGWGKDGWGKDRKDGWGKDRKDGWDWGW